MAGGRTVSGAWAIHLVSSVRILRFPRRRWAGGRRRAHTGYRVRFVEVCERYRRAILTLLKACKDRRRWLWRLAHFSSRREKQPNGQDERSAKEIYSREPGQNEQPPRRPRAIRQRTDTAHKAGERNQREGGKLNVIRRRGTNLGNHRHGQGNGSEADPNYP